MPKPLLLARPSGVYARFLVPKDLRALVGSRFLVRPLHAPFGDVARLVAARMGMALSHAFQALRQGQAVDIDEVLRRVRRNGVQQLILKGITFPNGAGVTEVEIKTPEDMAFWRETLEKMASADPVESIGLLPEHFLLKQQETHAKREATGRSVGLSLSKAIENHLTDLTNAKLQPKTILESRHTLRLFAGVVGEDLPVSELAQDHVREFFSAIRWWPSNASKRPAYRGMPVLEVMALAKANDEPEPAAWTIKKHRQRLSVFFISLVEAKRVGVNPLAGVRAVATPDEEDRGSPFTDSELGAIFGSAFVPWASKYPHRWFGPMLGLYSGARVNEVAQLQVDDIATVDGVPGFYVRVVARGQRIKGKHSRRFIPLAQAVLEGRVPGLRAGGQGRRPCAVVPQSPEQHRSGIWQAAVTPVFHLHQAARRRGKGAGLSRFSPHLGRSPRRRRCVASGHRRGHRTCCGADGFGEALHSPLHPAGPRGDVGQVLASGCVAALSTGAV